MKRFMTLALVAGILAGSASSSAQDKDKNPQVILDTSYGKIIVELNAEKAPITVKNFLQYVDDKHYDGTIFHRVIPTYVIQGGGFKEGMDKAKALKEFNALEKPDRKSVV